MFFFVSGGVDSTVAYTLCLRALGPERVYGLYVDTGLMRQDETEFVKRIFSDLGATHFRVEYAETEFLSQLAGLHEPEQKRRAIGEQFVRGAGTDSQKRPFSRWALDPGAGHYLSGYDRVWRERQGRPHQDTSQPCPGFRRSLMRTASLSR